MRRTRSPPPKPTRQLTPPPPTKQTQDKPQQPRAARVNAVSFLKKHGLQLDSLPERSRTVVYGVKADLTYIEYLKVRT